MEVSSIDNVLWIAGVVGEILLICFLLFRRSYKTFPFFTSYIAWVTVSDPLLLLVLALHRNQISGFYSQTYFGFNVIQYALESAVLVEIAVEVLRPARKNILRNVLLILVAAMVGVAIGALLVSAHLNAATIAKPRTLPVMNVTMAILRIIIFLVIAGFSQLLGLNWKNHVLQLASGLAFYAVVTLIVELAHSQLRSGPNYRYNYYALEHLRVGGYLCTLYFWCYVFAKKEAPRKEFSPQMGQFLVSLSGSAKRQRAVLARSRDE
jgi:uncharacterized membrane protein